MSQPDRRVIFRGRKLDLALEAIKLPDGTSTEREVVVHRGAVALLAMVDRDRVCLVRNQRYAVRTTLLEVPAGTLDEGEDPLATATRELREETGFTADRITPLTQWWVSPGLFTERMHLYLCEDLTPGATDLQPDERLEPVVVAWADAVNMVWSGEIQDAKSMLAILWEDHRRRASHA
jgi:ADP-ribose pyrophosphatase